MADAQRTRRLRPLQGGVPAEVAPAASGGIRLAVVVGREGEHFRVRAGRWERLAACDPRSIPPWWRPPGRAGRGWCWRTGRRR
jgi:hypothetical protein